MKTERQALTKTQRKILRDLLDDYHHALIIIYGDTGIWTREYNRAKKLLDELDKYAQEPIKVSARSVYGTRQR